MKERLDILLFNRGLVNSREKARSTIMAGVVYVDGNKEDKPGSRFDTESKIEIRENVNPYVSRGGLKLEKAISEFGICLEGVKAIDVGASTGGFTDCMLKNGAAKVFAVDVGYGQLAWELRNDKRVVCMERTNIRYLKPENVGEQLDFASIDVSFISLSKVLPAVTDILGHQGSIVCLVKPQFEAGRDKVGKHGVVRDPETHIQVLNKIIAFALESGLTIKGITFSPVKGPEGNIEYLLYLSTKDGIADVKQLEAMTVSTVTAAHQSL